MATKKKCAPQSEPPVLQAVMSTNPVMYMGSATTYTVAPIKAEVVNFGPVEVKVPNKKSKSRPKKVFPWESAFDYLDALDEFQWEPLSARPPKYLETVTILNHAREVFTMLRDKGWRPKSSPAHGYTKKTGLKNVSLDMYSPEDDQLSMDVLISAATLNWEKYGRTADQWDSKVVCYGNDIKAAQFLGLL